MVVADTPTIGLVIGLPVVILILIICAVLIFISFRMSDMDAPILGWGAAIVAVVTVIVALFAFWPLEHDYHFWSVKQGKIEKISSRFLSAGDNGGTNQRFVVVIHGQPYGIDDTRASLLKVGDEVRLKCKKEHQFMQKHSDDGWACRWGSSS